MLLFDNIGNAKKLPLDQITEEKLLKWYKSSRTAEKGLSGRLTLKVYPFGSNIRDKAEFESIKGIAFFYVSVHY